MEIRRRTYDNAYRKKLQCKLELVQDKQQKIDVFRIIQIEVGNDFTSNSNGLFFNMKSFSDDCIKALADYLAARK